MTTGSIPGLVRDRATWLLYLHMAAFGYFLYCFGPSVTLLGDDLGLGNAVAALHSTAYAAAGVLIALLGDRPMRRFGRGRTLWAGCALLSVGVPAYCAAGTPAVSLSAALLCGFGAFLVVNVAGTALADHHGPAAGPSALNEANGLAAGVGMIAPLLIGVLDSSGPGWRWAMYLVPVLFATLAITLGRTPIPGPAQAPEPIRTPKPSAGPSPVGTREGPETTPPIGIPPQTKPTDPVAGRHTAEPANPIGPASRTASGNPATTHHTAEPANPTGSRDALAAAPPISTANRTDQANSPATRDALGPTAPIGLPNRTEPANAANPAITRHAAEPAILPRVPPQQPDPASPAGAPEPHRQRREPAAAGPLPPAYWWAWLLSVCSVAVEFSLSLWASTLLRDRTGMSEGAAATAMTAVVAGLCLGRLVGGRLALRVPLDRLYAGAVVVNLVGFTAFWSATVPWLAYAGLFVSGLGMSVQFPLATAAAIRAAGSRADLAVSRLALATTLAAGGAPFLLGLATDLMPVRTAFLLLPILLLASLPVLRKATTPPPVTREPAPPLP
ncbi:MFS transporter [Embleya sp. AB8]|uniref:MFS transporter n=1 Tax=Embleya sp. AB8 TaxID=3156304 RepID=UPI003C784998